MLNWSISSHLLEGGENSYFLNFLQMNTTNDSKSTNLPKRDSDNLKPKLEGFYSDAKSSICKIIQEYNQKNDFSSSKELNKIISSVTDKYMWLVKYYNMSVKSWQLDSNLIISYKLTCNHSYNLTKTVLLEDEQEEQL